MLRMREEINTMDKNIFINTFFFFKKWGGG